MNIDAILKSGTSICANAGPDLGPLTLERIEESVRRARRLVDPIGAAQDPAMRVPPPAMPGLLAGIEVVENPLCVTVERVKRHRRRRGQSLAYHLRVDKKWLKRFGMREVPRVNLVNRSVIGRPGQVLVMHPSLVKYFNESFETRQAEAKPKIVSDEGCGWPLTQEMNDLLSMFGNRLVANPVSLVNLAGC